MSRQAVEKRRKAGRLIGVSLGRRGFGYPAWQFAERGRLRWGENSGRYFRLVSRLVKQSGRLETDGGTKNTCSLHEKGAQTGDDTIPA
jgi:hypothetical protein